MGAISTRAGRVLVGNTALLAATWSVEFTSDEVDSTNFEGGGFAEWIPSHVDARVSFDGFYDPAADPFANNPPAILAGNIVTVRLYIRLNNALSFYFPALSLFNVTVRGAVRDAVRYSVMGKNLGYFLYTGSTRFAGVDQDQRIS